MIIEIIDHFRKFADPYVKEFFDTTLKNRIERNPQSMLAYNYKKSFDVERYRNRLINKALDSREFVTLVEYLENFGLKDFERQVFGYKHSTNLVQELKTTLEWLIGFSEGSYEYYRNLDSDPKHPLFSRLVYAYHLVMDSTHTIKITIISNGLDLSKNFCLKNNISLTVSKLKNSYSQLEFEITETLINKDPVQLVKTFCGILSIFKKDFYGRISRIEFTCGCIDHGYGFEIDHSHNHNDKLIRFSIKEIDRIENFFNRIGQFDQIAFGIEKYYVALDKNSQIEKILFIVMSMELLFGKSKEIDSIKFRLTIRTINFISKKLEKRELIARKIREIYDTRSIIVHGNTSRKDNEKIRKCIYNIGNYMELLRLILLKFVRISSDFNNHGEIMNKVDYDLDISEMRLPFIVWK